MHFCSLEEAIDTIGTEKFLYVKSGGDDALILAWTKGTIPKLIDVLNNLPDNWHYEYRPPDEEGNLPFFDCNLAYRNNPHKRTWFFDTGVYFKPTDKLNRRCYLLLELGSPGSSP